MELDKQGRRWYKGNLHAHTTVSDGRMTPEECIALYQSKGYDFLALTEIGASVILAFFKNILNNAGIEAAAKIEVEEAGARNLAAVKEGIRKVHFFNDNIRNFSGGIA